MKKRLFLLFLLCALLLGICGTALAADIPVSWSMELSKNQFTGPDDVTVSISIKNAGDDDLPGPVYLKYPDGKPVTDFGDGGAATLKLGGVKTWTGTWHVTQRQLEAGKITFQVKYPVPTESGDVNYVSQYFSKAIIFNGAAPGLEVKRSFSTSVAQKDQVVTVTYDLLNTGNVTLNSIKVTENKSIASKAVTVDSLKANESKQVKFEVKMGTKDLTSSAKVTYKVAGSSKTETQTIDAATISYGEAKLKATLEASSKGVSIGETVELTLTLKNEGSVNYENLRVTDPTLGEVFSNQTLAASETKTLKKELTMQASGEYQFTILATDNTGMEISVPTEKVSITAVDPNKKLTLTVNAQADRLEVYSQPATVRFTVDVTNASESDATDVVLKHGATTWYSFDTIKAGETRRVVRDASISQAGRFQFTATCKDLLDNDVSFTSNEISIVYSVPTPAPTTVPQRTVAPPQLEAIPKTAGLPPIFSTVKSLSGILLGLSLTLLAGSLFLLAVAWSRRAAQKRQSEAALDHLERGTRRDYTLPSEEEEDGEFLRMVKDGEGEDPDAEPLLSLSEDELPHMKYVRGDSESETISSEKSSDDDVNKAESALRELTEEEAAILSGGTGHYRLTRSPRTATSDEEEQSSDPAPGYARRRRTAKTAAPSGEETPADM
jgi:hypothetical protein